MSNKIKSSVNPEDLAGIMNIIDDALKNTKYETVGYDNTGTWMEVFIDKKIGFSEENKYDHQSIGFYKCVNCCAISKRQNSRQYRCATCQEVYRHSQKAESAKRKREEKKEP